jgi:hypothetical protein
VHDRAQADAGAGGKGFNYAIDYTHRRIGGAYGNYH